jgi:hypothetical protein
VKNTTIERPVYDLEGEDGERILLVDDQPLNVISAVLCVDLYAEAERVRAAADAKIQNLIEDKD